MILNGRSDGTLQSSGRPLDGTGKKGNGRGQLEAWSLALQEGVLNVFYDRGTRKMGRGKVPGSSSQRAKESSRRSGHHAAEPKATKP